MTQPSTHRASPEAVRHVVLALLAQLAPEVDLRALRPDRPLREQIDLDSMDWLNFAVGVQERLGVAIPDEALARPVTLDALVALVASLSPTPLAATLALPRHHRLDGVDIVLRPMAAEDAPMEADFVRRLSELSRYKRFMGTVRELPEAKLRYLTDVDGVHHVALVATTLRDGGELQLGVARYVVEPSGTACEFAVAVDDAWQGSGLAGILMHALIDIARQHGLAIMAGSVLAANLPMLRFARQIGFEVQTDPDDAKTRRVVLKL